jgi:hypothetical protein
MPNSITADELLGGVSQRPVKVATAPGGAITAQELLDAVPVNRAQQPQLVDDAGNDYDVNQLDSPSTMYNVPQLRVEQRPTGADVNVQRGSSGFGANFKAGLVEDPRTKIAMHAKALFPNDPNAEQRFGIRDGKIVYIDDERNIRDVDSGIGSASGNALAYTPETAGAIAGSVATGNPVVGGALGAMAGKGLKQIAAGLFLDEPQTSEGNLKGMLTEGVVNLVGGGVAKGVGKFFNKGRVVDFTPNQAANAAATRTATEGSTGITLDLAQASGDPVLMSLRKYAAKFPGESAQIFKALDDLQTGQSADAMERLIATVAKSQSSEAAGKGGINAAQAAIRGARAGVSAKVKPLYDAAYAAVPEVTDPKILGMLKLPHFPKALAAAKEMAELEGVDTSKNSLQLLDYVKRGLDDQIDAMKASGNRQLARAVKMKRDEFVAALDAIPNQEWKAARAKYAELAKTSIEPLENGAVGVLASITDKRAATAAAKMFTDPNISPKEIAFARSQIEKADPDAWRGLTAQYLGNVLNGSLKVSQKGETINLAGKIYQSLAGTPSQMAKLRAALPAESQAMAGEVLNALKLVAATERAGSDTAFNQLVTRKIEGRMSTTLKMFRQPVQQIIQAGEERELDRMVKSLAVGLTDPAQVAKLRQVTKASPGMQKALNVLSILTVVPGERALEDEINPMADQPIPASGPTRYRSSPGR